MQTTEFTTTILKAEPGMMLTQAADVEISERAVASEVALGRGRSADEWREITAEEAAAIKARKEAWEKEQEELLRKEHGEEISAPEALPQPQPETTAENAPEEGGEA